MAKRHRKGSSKVVITHHMITGLREKLEELAEWPEITTIAGGRIHYTHSSRGPGITLKVSMPTSTGLKVTAKNNTSVQEVCIVTGQPDAVRRKIEAAS